MSRPGPGEHRAASRPLVIASLALVRLLAGFALALPLASVAAESGVGHHAAGDRVLFEAGGYQLLELLRLQGPSLLATLRGLLPLLPGGLLLTAACNVVLLVTLDTQGSLRLAEWLPRSVQRLPVVLTIGAGAGLCQLAVLMLGGSLVAAVPSWMTRPVQQSALELGTWLVFLALASAVGGVADVAKACSVRHESGFAQALQHTAARLRARPLVTCFGWLPYGAVFVAAVLAVAPVTEALDVSSPGAWRVVLVLVCHQAVIALAVALRAAWYARALRLAAT